MEQCAANTSLSKYYSDAFGLFILLLGVTGASLQLPLRHRWQFGGARTAFWLPEDYWELGNDHQAHSHVLNFSISSGNSGFEANRKDILQGLAAFERTVVVATSASPGLRPRRSLMASPLEWLSDLCTAALQERPMGADGLTQGQGDSSMGGDPDGSRTPESGRAHGKK